VVIGRSFAGSTLFCDRQKSAVAGDAATALSLRIILCFTD
jgi:hypothetical protein